MRYLLCRQAQVSSSYDSIGSTQFLHFSRIHMITYSVKIFTVYTFMNLQNINRVHGINCVSSKLGRKRTHKPIFYFKNFHNSNPFFSLFLSLQVSTPNVYNNIHLVLRHAQTIEQLNIYSRCGSSITKPMTQHLNRESESKFTSFF